MNGTAKTVSGDALPGVHAIVPRALRGRVVGELVLEERDGPVRVRTELRLLARTGRDLRPCGGFVLIESCSAGDTVVALEGATLEELARAAIREGGLASDVGLLRRLLGSVEHGIEGDAWERLEHFTRELADRGGDEDETEDARVEASGFFEA